MALYSEVAVLVVALLFCINLIFFHRSKLLSKKDAYVISVSSLVISITFPLILSGFIKTSTSSSFIFSLCAAVLTCLALIAIIALLISYSSEGDKIEEIISYQLKGVSLDETKKSDKAEFVEVDANTSVIQSQDLALSGQGKNILEKSVDTEQNIDTMGIETCNSESVFLNVDKVNSTEIKASEGRQEYMNDLDNTPRDIVSNETEIENNDNFIDDEYEVFEDYFEDEILDEFQVLESKYADESQIAEENSTDAISPVHDENIGFLSETENEYLNECLDIVLNEEISDDADENKIISDAANNGNNFVDFEDQSTANKEKEQLEEQRNAAVEEASPASMETMYALEVKSVEESIEDAFKLKEKGDFEGAILSFLYALDNEPEDDVVFWIVLDICVLYKQLGQVELAREVLQSYISQFGEIMNESVKREIEKNLQ